MARLINRLSARHVDLARAPGRYGDGAGLYLVIGASGGRQWVFRYRFGGVRRDIGLGSAGKGGVSLAHARVLAAEARKLLAEGRDPLRERAKVQADEQAARAASRVPTFQEVAHFFVDRLVAAPRWQSSRQRARRASYFASTGGPRF